MALAIQEQLQPLLEAVNDPDTEDKSTETTSQGGPDSPEQKKRKTPKQKVMRKTFKGTAILTKFLPTGAVLTFQLLSPILTHQGKCNTHVSQYLTITLIALCSISCFLLCFTDSFKDERGKVRYGMATFGGLFVMDETVSISAEESAKYKIKFVDFLHGFMTMFVFASVALFDQNVVKCFFSNPSDEVKDLLVVVPIGISVVCCVLFVCFPSKRHGIGFPLSRN
ncbi:hypothetical protein ACFE04_029860 [Oxalis oulophora]